MLEEYVPAPHFKHEPEDEAPSVVAYVPAAQYRQKILEEAPEKDE